MLGVNLAVWSRTCAREHLPKSRGRALERVSLEQLAQRTCVREGLLPRRLLFLRPRTSSGHFRRDRFDSGKFARTRESSTPRFLELLELSLDLRFSFYEGINPNRDARRGSIALCGNDGNRRFLYFLDMRVPDVLVCSDEDTLLSMTVPNDAWVFDSILRPSAAHVEHLRKALHFKAGVFQLLRVGRSAKGIL